jgi:hypothetical protein
MRRPGGSRGARGAWIAAIVVIVLIVAVAAAQMGGGGQTAGGAVASGTAAGATAASGQATSPAAGGTATASGAATATASASAGGSATGSASAEAGGPPAVVSKYFADLAAGSYQAAYDLIAPSWQAKHSLAAFVSALPPQAPQLTSATLGSVANFDATVDVTFQPATGGAPKTEAVQLVDVNQATPSNAALWLLQAPPAGVGG